MHRMFSSTARARSLLLMLGALLVAERVFAATPVSKLGSAKEDEAPMEILPLPAQPDARATSSPTAVPDAVFWRAVLWAFEPTPVEVRAQAIEDLGLLGDPRALNVLAQYVTDANPIYARAALRAVSLMRQARAEDILCNVARHPAVPEPLKVFAVEALTLQNTASAISFLRQVAAGPEFSNALRAAARAALNEVPRARGGSL